MEIKIAQAQPKHSTIIARLIMEAMNHECCQWFAGEEHTLDDFFNLMKSLVERTDSQYSYCNTLVAITPDGTIAGICVSYDAASFAL